MEHFNGPGLASVTDQKQATQLISAFRFHKSSQYRSSVSEGHKLPTYGLTVDPSLC